MPQYTVTGKNFPPFKTPDRDEAFDTAKEWATATPDVDIIVSKQIAVVRAERGPIEIKVINTDKTTQKEN